MADEDNDNGTTELNSALVSGLSFRSIGPAFMSGRIGDIAVDPVKKSTWYVAVASGNVWKTTNAGNTWDPIFDSYGSYSIGCVTVDPNNRHVIWVGTGENNSQRSVGFGDGVYKSLDGGKSFEKTGLDSSEHIGRILVDPRNSDVVFVAAQGPLWSPGGDRGLYKTTDGGESWELVLEISENTGVSDICLDPRDPDIIYATSYQRRRHVWTLIDGGPESGIHKSTDGGKTWREINNGLPGGDRGRIGLAISPIDPDVLYAIVEATDDKGGFFRSSDRGENWNKMSDYSSGSPQYYQEIYADPHQFDRVFSMDVVLRVTEDGGRTFNTVPRQHKHVDNHAMVFDSDDPEHWIVGCDGGIYETWDSGENWDFKSNLPVTQFYKVAIDNDLPFYNVYGGTQDNYTQGGPSRTDNVHGIRNCDWFMTLGGDGFDPAVDPLDPNIVYSQWQHGNLVRFDRRTGQKIDIKPREEKDGPPLRWNWDAALMISPHLNTRLYFGAQILFQSDDRGESWQAISPDLTRDLDRNKLEVMGRVWSADAIAKNWNTSYYGNIVSVSESPLLEGLIYVGTDDGLIQATENGGQSWLKVDKAAGVHQYVYISDIEASLHDTNTVFAALDNHKMGDFRPYVAKSTDRGKTWKLISGDLPERGTVYTIAQDHVNRNLLFAGTEFGVFFTVDGGAKWIQLSSGMPTICIRDIEIQRRENDLVAASFGRGFFILDDYTPLRQLSEESIQQDATIFPIKKALMYIQATPLGGGEKGSQGAGYFTAPNPPFGATFTYYIKESLKTRKEIRRKQEKKLAEDGGDVFYPSWEDLEAESREEKPAVFLTVEDMDGNTVRRVSGSASKGIHRATWDFRYPDYAPVRLNSDDNGPLALPGDYTVTLQKRVDGVTTTLAGPVRFTVETLGQSSIPEADRADVLAFQRKTGSLQRAVLGANAVARDAQERIDFIKQAVKESPQVEMSMWQDIRDIELRLKDIRTRFNGWTVERQHNEPSMPGIISRVNSIVYGHWSSTSGPTDTHKRLYDIAADEFEAILGDLRQLVEIDLVDIEKQLEEAGVPWTPGRPIPDWQRE